MSLQKSAKNCCNGQSSRVRRKTDEILRQLLRAQSKTAILGLHADLRKLTQSELEGLLNSLSGNAASTIRRQPRERVRGTGDGSPVSRVLHLLRSESKLTDREAIVELKRELGRSASSAELGEEKSLEDWARAFCDKAPAGELLSAALTVVEQLKAAQKRRSQRRPRRGRGPAF